MWGVDWIGDERTVDVHVRQLRKKLGDGFPLVDRVGRRLPARLTFTDSSHVRGTLHTDEARSHHRSEAGMRRRITLAILGTVAAALLLAGLGHARR